MFFYTFDILELFLIEWIWLCKVLVSLGKAGHGCCPEKHCQVSQFYKAFWSLFLANLVFSFVSIYLVYWLSILNSFWAGKSWIQYFLLWSWSVVCWTSLFQERSYYVNKCFEDIYCCLLHSQTDWKACDTVSTGLWWHPDRTFLSEGLRILEVFESVSNS